MGKVGFIIGFIIGAVFAIFGGINIFTKYVPNFLPKMPNPVFFVVMIIIVSLPFAVIGAIIGSSFNKDF